MSYSLKKILLAVADAGAKNAITRAAQIAQRSHARIELYSAVKPVTQFITGKARALDASKARLDQKLKELEGVAKRLRADGLSVSCQADLEYSPADGILRRVKAARPDLVVIQAHKHGLLARLMLSQTDFDLIRRCPVPLLIVKTAQPAGRPSMLAALDPWHVGGKPAALDEHLVEVAHAVSQGLGAKLHAAHVHA
ncbi:MAG: universal stress protein, partial [Proteobacteria bacterium]|nr:universal stress protein [Pseudomonadota bacterium]